DTVARIPHASGQSRLHVVRSSSAVTAARFGSCLVYHASHRRARRHRGAPAHERTIVKDASNLSQLSTRDIRCQRRCRTELCFDWNGESCLHSLPSWAVRWHGDLFSQWSRATGSPSRHPVREEFTPSMSKSIRGLLAFAASSSLVLAQGDKPPQSG